MTCLWHVVLWQIESVIVRTATCSSLSLGSFRFTTRQLDDLKWLVRKPRQTGGVSYSSAITYGLSTGRGWKPYQAPRKREDADILLPMTLERFQGQDLQKIGIFFTMQRSLSLHHFQNRYFSSTTFFAMSNLTIQRNNQPKHQPTHAD